MRPRNYQVEIAGRAAQVLIDRGVVYLAMQMRTGKTITALETAARISGCRKVLFVTKKMAVASVKKDYEGVGYPFSLIVCNHESVHKHAGKYDVVVVDEAHCLGMFPRPAKRTVELRKIVGATPLILLSGTPSPESYSQLYHQFWVSDRSPFAAWPTFYKWVHAGFVEPRVVSVSGHTITQYKKANKKMVDEACRGLFITFSQEEANFEVAELEDEIIQVPINSRIHRLVEILKADRYYQFKNGDEVTCDTAVKLQNKVHQIYSGTLICDDRLSPGGTLPVVRTLDESKAKFILENYAGKKIAIFYLYVQEGEVLKRTFKGRWTGVPERFHVWDDLVFISQFQSGARGIDLSAADVIVMYNIHFSSELYQQARQRGQERGKAVATRVHWLFSQGGIERKIYDAVIKKQDYTLSYFMRDFDL